MKNQEPPQKWEAKSRLREFGPLGTFLGEKITMLHLQQARTDEGNKEKLLPISFFKKIILFATKDLALRFTVLKTRQYGFNFKV